MSSILLLLQKCVELLIKAGVSINAQDSMGIIALHYAGACGHEDVFQFLIDSGADRSLKDEDGIVATLAR